MNLQNDIREITIKYRCLWPAVVASRITQATILSQNVRLLAYYDVLE